MTEITVQARPGQSANKALLEWAIGPQGLTRKGPAVVRVKYGNGGKPRSARWVLTETGSLLPFKKGVGVCEATACDHLGYDLQEVLDPFTPWAKPMYLCAEHARNVRAKWAALEARQVRPIGAEIIIQALADVQASGAGGGE